MPKKLTTIRKRLRKAEQTSKSKFIRTEAKLARAIINEPRAIKRATMSSNFKKPLIDAPQQLEKRRIRPFVVLSPGGGLGVIDIKRKGK